MKYRVIDGVLNTFACVLCKLYSKIVCCSNSNYFIYIVDRQLTDHLGFAIASEAAFKVYEKSQAEYLKVLHKRSQRWKTFLLLRQYKTDSRKCK